MLPFSYHKEFVASNMAFGLDWSGESHLQAGRPCHVSSFAAYPSRLATVAEPVVALAVDLRLLGTLYSLLRNGNRTISNLALAGHRCRSDPLPFQFTVSLPVLN